MNYDGRKIFRFDTDKEASYNRVANFYGVSLGNLIRMLLDREVENLKKQKKEKK